MVWRLRRRRRWLVEGVPAVTVFNTEQGNRPAVQSGGPARRVIGEKLQQKHRLTEHEVGFLKQHAPGPFKMTMAAASYVLARSYRPGVTDKVYGYARPRFRTWRA